MRDILSRRLHHPPENRRATNWSRKATNCCYYAPNSGRLAPNSTGCGWSCESAPADLCDLPLSASCHTGESQYPVFEYRTGCRIKSAMTRVELLCHPKVEPALFCAGFSCAVDVLVYRDLPLSAHEDVRRPQKSDRSATRSGRLAPHRWWCRGDPA